MYFAYERDNFVCAMHDLRQLLALVAELRSDSDTAIWFGREVVAVVHPKGRRVTWIRPRHAPAAA